MRQDVGAIAREEMLAVTVHLEGDAEGVQEPALGLWTYYQVCRDMYGVGYVGYV